MYAERINNHVASVNELFRNAQKLEQEMMVYLKSINTEVNIVESVQKTNDELVESVQQTNDELVEQVQSDVLDFDIDKMMSEIDINADVDQTQDTVISEIQKIESDVSEKKQDTIKQKKELESIDIDALINNIVIGENLNI